MKKQEAYFTNQFFLLNDANMIVGFESDGQQIMLGDRVRIKADSHGYIASSIKKEGYGIVIDFTNGYTDHYFGVIMDNGEYAHLKCARIAEVFHTGIHPFDEEAGKTKKAAFSSGEFFILDYDGKIVGYECAGPIKWKIAVGDRVKIKADCCGYITPGITEEGYGMLTDIVEDSTDHYFGVLMDNGEYGHMKSARIAEVSHVIAV